MELPTSSKSRNTILIQLRGAAFQTVIASGIDYCFCPCYVQIAGLVVICAGRLSGTSAQAAGSFVHAVAVAAQAFLIPQVMKTLVFQLSNVLCCRLSDRCCIYPAFEQYSSSHRRKRNFRMKRYSRCILCVLGLSSMLVASAQSPDPTTTPLPVSTVDYMYNTSAPAANASVITVIPPETLASSSELQNVTFSSIGFELGATASQFNASIPLQADNTTVAPLESFNTSVASLLPENTTSATNDSNTLLIANPSWGKEIVVPASSLNTTQLVVSSATDLGSTTAFTTVYNTTTVSNAHSRSSCAFGFWLVQQCTAKHIVHSPSVNPSD